MAKFTQTDWYRFPFYYDTVFGPDTPKEANFIEAVWAAHGPKRRPRRARMLEPACGTGRLVIELARRGHAVTGFDGSPEMIAYAKQRAAAEPPPVRRRVQLTKARMESFRLPDGFHVAYCLLSTFKYLLTAAHALAHLRRIARALVPGGLYVIGIHLTDYSRKWTDIEVWRGRHDGISVMSETITRPAVKRTRLEWLRNRLEVRESEQRAVKRLETRWQCRTYDAAELASLFDKVAALEVIGCYDFAHDISLPRGFDDFQEDLVVVLRKRRVKS